MAPAPTLVRDYVPQLELLAQMDAVLCHAGQNTVAEALANGLPLVMTPSRLPSMGSLPKGENTWLAGWLLTVSWRPASLPSALAFSGNTAAVIGQYSNPCGLYLGDQS